MERKRICILKTDLNFYKNNLKKMLTFSLQVGIIKIYRKLRHEKTNCDDGEKDFRIPKESMCFAESMRYSVNAMITLEQMSRKVLRVDDSGCLRYRARAPGGLNRGGTGPVK